MALHKGIRVQQYLDEWSEPDPTKPVSNTQALLALIRTGPQISLWLCRLSVRPQTCLWSDQPRTAWWQALQ